MNKINILILMLLIAPIFTFLLFSHRNTNQNPIIYLHEHKDKSNHAKSLLNSFSSTGNVILLFYSEQCGPCKRMRPLTDNYALTHSDYTFIYINRDFFKDLTTLFNITSVPTLIFLRNGKTISRYEGGPLTETTLKHLITKTYSKNH